MGMELSGNQGTTQTHKYADVAVLDIQHLEIQVLPFPSGFTHVGCVTLLTSLAVYQEIGILGEERAQELGFRGSRLRA